MHLTTDEVKRFFRIWFPLLYYVNQQRSLVPSFPDQWGTVSVQPQDALPLRDALWEDDTLRETFIANNPAHLSPDDLALVASWKHRTAGEFFIYRHLKKYTVMLDGNSPPHAYGVLGLTSSIAEIVGPYLPIYVKAVLLPFGDRIIYDGLLMPYPIHFGGGYRSSLDDAYRDVKERGGIITTLLPNAKTNAPEHIRKTTQVGNKQILATFQKSLGQAGLSPRMIEEHTGVMTRFAQEFLLTLNPPRSLLDITGSDIQSYFAAQKGEANRVSFKRFARFLRDTGRMDFDQAEKLIKLLK